MRAGAALPDTISWLWGRQGAERWLPENEMREGTARDFPEGVPVLLVVRYGTADVTSNRPSITARSIISMIKNFIMRSASKGVEARWLMAVINSVSDISGIVIVSRKILYYIY